MPYFRLCNREALLIFEPQLMQGSLAHKILYKNKIKIPKQGSLVLHKIKFLEQLKGFLA
jgi:hypothetical protein